MHLLQGMLYILQNFRSEETLMCQQKSLASFALFYLFVFVCFLSLNEDKTI